MDKFYLDLTKKWLMNLNAYKENLNTLEILKEEVTIDSPISYDKERLSPTFKIYLDTEEKAIELYRIERGIRSINNKVNTVENNLDKLLKNEKEILKLKYIEGWKLNHIAQVMNYNYEYASRLSKRSLQKLCDLMFGFLIEN